MKRPLLKFLYSDVCMNEMVTTTFTTFLLQILYQVQRVKTELSNTSEVMNEMVQILLKSQCSPIKATLVDIISSLNHKGHVEELKRALKLLESQEMSLECIPYLDLLKRDLGKIVACEEMLESQEKQFVIAALQRLYQEGHPLSSQTEDILTAKIINHHLLSPEEICIILQLLYYHGTLVVGGLPRKTLRTIFEIHHFHKEIPGIALELESKFVKVNQDREIEDLAERICWTIEDPNGYYEHKVKAADSLLHLANSFLPSEGSPYACVYFSLKL